MPPIAHAFDLAQNVESSRRSHDACVKGQAIWVTAAREYVEGANKDVVMALSAWSIALSQDVGTLAVMERRR